MSGYNVEYIDENWQDSQKAYVNTAIAYLVILTSGSGCLLLPKMPCTKWPCSGLPYDGATYAKCENWGYSEFSLTIKISMIYQVCRYCSLSVKINTRQMPHSLWRLWTYFARICFPVRVWQGLKHPQLELHGWQWDFLWLYRSPGIFFLNLGLLHYYQYQWD